MWKQWVNLILGLAVIATPFLSLSTDTSTWTLVVLGAVIAILSLWNASEERTEEYHEQALRHMHQT
jgi:hypothetical protein